MPYYKIQALEETPEVHCGVWISSPGTWYHPILTEKHSLLWILDGSALIECRDGQTFEVPPNGIYCAPPGIEYVVRWDARRMTRWGWLNFLPDDAAALPRLRLARPDDVVIPLLNHTVALTLDRPPDWAESAVLARDYAIRIFASGNSSTRIASFSVYSELIARLIATIQRHWDGSTMRALPVTELATELGVTSRHLSRVFEKQFGVGPGEAIRTLRILKAAELLTETNRPIREIASHVGFANHYHFSSVFKATIGVPPGEYRLTAPESTLVPPQLVQLGGSFRTPTADAAVSHSGPDGRSDSRNSMS